jgi:PPK2 family polyphosphate:nucleotide phosphotransferase
MHPKLSEIVARCRITNGQGFTLAAHDPSDTGSLDLKKSEAGKLLERGVERLAELQDKLYAQDRWSVLCIFQAMDAAGKDGAIKHVFSGVNPQGCHAVSFKAPTATELDHDFLWRHIVALPPRGMIGIHNRSWYEEVLVARIHPAILDAQKLPPRLRTPRIFDDRLEDIAGFERYLARQGTIVLKFFLHLSRDEQRQRFLARIAEPEKNWKFNAGDVAERAHWDAYQTAYEAAIRATATPESPWFVVPADTKWLTRMVVSAAIAETLDTLDLHYPAPTAAQRRGLQEAKEALER